MGAYFASSEHELLELRGRGREGRSLSWPPDLGKGQTCSAQSGSDAAAGSPDPGYPWVKGPPPLSGARP